MRFWKSAIPTSPHPLGCRERLAGASDAATGARVRWSPFAAPASFQTKNLSTLKHVHTMFDLKAVYGVKRHLPQRRSIHLLLGVPLLLSAWAFADGGDLMAAEAAAALVPAGQPAKGLPAVGQEEPPGAAALLDDLPLRVGLREHGFPAPLAPEPPLRPNQEEGRTAGPEPAAEPAPPAGVQPAVSESRLLILDRRRKVLRVLERGRELRRYPVAVGMPGWETPVGQFTVIEKRANPTWEHPASGDVLPPGPSNPLGSRWIGFHRDCRGRRGFNGQEHLVVNGCVEAGFHGTPNRASVGRAVSHGCVRLFDEDARELFDLVSLGTPVTVLP